jgi:hypothetical protein
VATFWAGIQELKKRTAPRCAQAGPGRIPLPRRCHWTPAGKGVTSRAGVAMITFSNQMIKKQIFTVLFFPDNNVEYEDRIRFITIL